MTEVLFLIFYYIILLILSKRQGKQGSSLRDIYFEHFIILPEWRWEAGNSPTGQDHKRQGSVLCHNKLESKKVK